jgi:hypothetical protein
MGNKTRVTISDQQITIRSSTHSLSLPNISLPPPLISWLNQGRLDVYRRLLTDSASIDFFQQHLPVLVTHSPDSPFPFNCGNKGVGFLPKETSLNRYIEQYRETIAATRAVPWQESLTARIAAARAFHEDIDAIDFRCLTSIEIFQRKTFRNIQNFPLASLLFTGASPEYKSFQINCAVEIIDREDPRFTFIKLSRRLFEFDGFHIAQPDFQFGYLFWISEVKDKTPHRVTAVTADSYGMNKSSSLPWEEEALSILRTLPAWSRSHIRKQIENYGTERGFETITVALVQEAQKVLRH